MERCSRNTLIIIIIIIIVIIMKYKIEQNRTLVVAIVFKMSVVADFFHMSSTWSYVISRARLSCWLRCPSVCPSLRLAWRKLQH